MVTCLPLPVPACRVRTSRRLDGCTRTLGLPEALGSSGSSGSPASASKQIEQPRAPQAAADAEHEALGAAPSSLQAAACCLRRRLGRPCSQPLAVQPARASCFAALPPCRLNGQRVGTRLAARTAGMGCPPGFRW